MISIEVGGTNVAHHPHVMITDRQRDDGGKNILPYTREDLSSFTDCARDGERRRRVKRPDWVYAETVTPQLVISEWCSTACSCLWGIGGWMERSPGLMGMMIAR